MIDKLDLRVPRKAPFTPAFGRLYRELQASERRPFHPSKLYEYCGDLREYGIGLRLNLYCKMDKAGNHKVELIDSGSLTRSQMLAEVGQVFEVPASALGVMRVDFAVDVPKLPVQWFRETVSVAHKRFRAAVTGQPFYSEMGNGDIETLYFGKRPNVIRIYDKQSERRHEYWAMVRKLGKDVEPPTFESIYGCSMNDTILTRVERQIGTRIPPEIASLQRLFESAFEFQPFAALKIIDHAASIPPDSNQSFETYCTGLHLRSIAERDGMQAVKRFISKHSKRNAAWAWKKYRSYLPSASDSYGITAAQLQGRFVESIVKQLAA